MPKAMLSSYNKMQRLELLRDKFKERLRLTSSDVRAFYANIDGQDSENLRRLAHRDLETLTNEGFLRVFDEEDTVTEVTGEIAPGKRALYMIAAARENDIDGSGYLRALGGDMVASMKIRNGVRIEAGFQTETKSHSMILDLPGGLLSFLIDKEELPIRLIISRRIQQSHTNILQAIEEARPGSTLPPLKRVGVLLLPVATLSALRDHEKLGHLLIDFLPSKIQIMDLKSKNKTFIRSLTSDQFEATKQNSTPRSNITVTAGFNTSTEVGEALTPTPAFKPIAVSTPTFIQATKDLRIILA